MQNTEHKDFLDNIVNMVFDNLVCPMAPWTRADLSEGLDYLSEKPYGDDRIRNDIAEALVILIGYMSGSDEDMPDGFEDLDE